MNLIKIYKGWLVRVVIAAAIGVFLASSYLRLEEPSIRNLMIHLARSGQSGVAVAEEALVNYLGEHFVLQYRTRSQIKQLDREMARLQWIEAESTVAAQALAPELEKLLATQEEARQGLVQLAVWIESGDPVPMDNGNVLSIDELKMLANQKKLAYLTLEAKVALQRDALQAHQDASSQARTLWTEARYGIDQLVAYGELLEANSALQKTAGTEAQPLRQQLEQTTTQLLSQIERDRRITEKRRAIEAQMSAADIESGEQGTRSLESLLSSSADLAAELRDLAER